MAIAATPSPAYKAKLAALAEVHSRWVAGHLDAPFEPRTRKSDYNLHYADIEAADDDAFHAQARKALGLPAGSSRTVDQRGKLADEDDLDDIGPLDHDCLALLAAIVELLEDWAGRAKLTGSAFNAVHPRGPGGRFRSTVDRLKDAIESHVKGGKGGHPFDDFNREQLRKVAKARGISLKRGEDRDSIAQKLLDHLKGGGKGEDNTPPKPKAPAKPRKPRTSTPKPPAPKPEPTVEPTKSGAKIEPITARELEILKATRELPEAEARLASARTPEEKAGAQHRLDQLHVKIEQRPNAGYNWDSPYWDQPAGWRVQGAPSAEQIDAHIERVFEGTHHQPLVRKQAGEDLQHQGQLAPRSLLDLHAFQDGSKFQHDVHTANAVAYYQSHTITMHPNASLSEYVDDLKLASTIRSGWWVPTDKGYIRSIVSHEFGHHIHQRIDTATPEKRRRLVAVLDEQLGAGGAIRNSTALLDTALEDWLELRGNRDRAAQLVSRYGSKNGHELLAEIWSEYSASDNPRPHITAIGDAMRDAAEDFEVVTTQ